MFRNKSTVLLSLSLCSLFHHLKRILHMGSDMRYMRLAIYPWCWNQVNADRFPLSISWRNLHTCLYNRKRHFIFILVIYLCLGRIAASNMMFLSFSSEYSIVQVFCNTYNLLTVSLSTSFTWGVTLCYSKSLHICHPW